MYVPECGSKGRVRGEGVGISDVEDGCGLYILTASYFNPHSSLHHLMYQLDVVLLSASKPVPVLSKSVLISLFSLRCRCWHLIRRLVCTTRLNQYSILFWKDRPTLKSLATTKQS